MNRIYEHVTFPDAWEDRPYTFMNMITTVDGKSISGDRNEPVMDLGSKVDHLALRDLESHADALMIGAETLRATPKIWFDNRLIKIVVTRSGDVPLESRFFSDDPTRAIIAIAQDQSSLDLPESLKGVRIWNFGASGKLLSVVQRLHRELKVQRLLIEGGSELNALCIRENLVDEFFLTLAPKLKLGRETPTMAGGAPLARKELKNLELISAIPVENEVFLRYRRIREHESHIGENE